MNPRARRDGLAVRTVDDELVIYDRTRDVAHRLNRPAALVWRHCDGRTDVPALSMMVRRTSRLAGDERFVWLALDELDRAHLLLTADRPGGRGRVSRRELLGLVRGNGALLPRCESVEAAPISVIAAVAGGAGGVGSPHPGSAAVEPTSAAAKAKCATIRKLISFPGDPGDCVGEKQDCPATSPVEAKLLMAAWRTAAGEFCDDDGECEEGFSCKRDTSITPTVRTVKQFNPRQCTDKDKPYLCFPVVAAFAFCVCEKDG